MKKKRGHAGFRQEVRKGSLLLALVLTYQPEAQAKETDPSQWMPVLRLRVRLVSTVEQDF